MVWGYHFNLKLPDALGQRIARVQEALSQKTGIPLDRSKTIRYLLERAIPTLEEELGIKGGS